MYRTLLLVSASMSLFIPAASAQKYSAPYGVNTTPVYLPESPANRRWLQLGGTVAAQQADMSRNEADQIIRWGKVGRCVVGSDRDGSAAFAKTTYPSHAARAAANRLTPAFDACLAGTGVKARSNVALRQAAVIDALNTAPAKP